MALYIKDSEVIKLVLSQDGIKLIKEFILNKEGELPIFEAKDSGYTLLTRCFMSNDGINYTRSASVFSNTLMVSLNEICINPTMDLDRQYYTNDLYHYILDLKSEIRNLKIKKIL
jgi:hypothetical protein